MEDVVKDFITYIENSYSSEMEKVKAEYQKSKKSSINLTTKSLAVVKNDIETSNNRQTFENIISYLAPKQ
ncbi:MAG TPA: hypothetical protein EYG73_06930 [Arcobacter sp.]|nr:hypothetical protein [Arcobacter sp.]